MEIYRKRQIKKRVEELKATIEEKPPYHVMGRYYDELTNKEKADFWRYIYGDTFSTEEAEQMELKHITGTLHFICSLKPCDVELPGIDADLALLDRFI